MYEVCYVCGVVVFLGAMYMLAMVMSLECLCVFLEVVFLCCPC